MAKKPPNKKNLNIIEFVLAIIVLIILIGAYTYLQDQEAELKGNINTDSEAQKTNVDITGDLQDISDTLEEIDSSLG